MSEFRKDLVTEAIAHLRECRLMQRANEAAAKMAELHESCRAYAREEVERIKHEVKKHQATVLHQIELLKQEILDIEKEIEILGGVDVFNREHECQQLFKTLTETQTQLQYADRI